jgi:uncharacterized membrane protein
MGVYLKLMSKKIWLFIILTLILSSFALGATLKGSIYNTQLELENDVLVEIDTVPVQKYLAKDGTYQFELNQGSYTLKVRKSFISVNEIVEIVNEGIFVFDVFLISDFSEEEELWTETDEDYLSEENEEEGGILSLKYEQWRYWVAGIIILILLWRFYKKRKKYGSVKKFRNNMKVEHRKSIDQHKRDLVKEPGYLEEVLELIKKNDGRITQKKLRREMLHLSEAKVSLILTELEHKNLVEKVKKGRGNVILLK